MFTNVGGNVNISEVQGKENNQVLNNLNFKLSLNFCRTV